MIVIMSIGGLRNMRGRSILVVFFEILFPSHLMQCDGTAHVVATCQVSIGQRWACPSTRPLVFRCFSFASGKVLKAFLFLFLLLHVIFLHFLPANLSLSKLELPRSFSFSGTILSNPFHFLFNALMVEFYEVRNLFPFVSFFFARLGSFLEASSGYHPQVGLWSLGIVPLNQF